MLILRSKSTTHKKNIKSKFFKVSTFVFVRVFSFHTTIKGRKGVWVFWGGVDEWTCKWVYLVVVFFFQWWRGGHGSCPGPCISGEYVKRLTYLLLLPPRTFRHFGTVRQVFRPRRTSRSVRRILQVQDPLSGKCKVFDCSLLSPIFIFQWMEPSHSLLVFWREPGPGEGWNHILSTYIQKKKESVLCDLRTGVH